MKAFFKFIWSFIKPKNFFHYDNFLSLGLFILIFIGIAKVNIEFLNPISDAFSDVELTDIVYSQFGKNNEYREIKNGEGGYDTSITIVNIGHLNRGEIATMISYISQFEPKVIGLDASFDGPKDSIMDLYMADVIKNTPNLVMTCKGDGFDTKSLEKTNGAIKFKNIENNYSLFHSVCKYHGFVNMHTKHLSSSSVVDDENFQNEDTWIDDEFVMCRKFFPKAYIESDKSYLNFFSVEVAKLYSNKKVDELLKRNKTTEIVNYIGYTQNFKSQKSYFKVYEWTSILLNEDTHIDANDFKNKIVLLGYLGEFIDDNVTTAEDRFFTPLNEKYIGKAHEDMFGVVVHANIISTILKGIYIDEMPDVFGKIFGLIVAFFVFAIYRPIYYDYKVWYDGVTKLIGIIVVFLIMCLIGYVFWKYDYEIKFSPIFIGVILLAGDYLEIYYGLGKNIARKLKKKKIEV